MQFITEMDLRDLYKKEPFSAYMIEPASRLTPEARQFLIDRGIKISEASSRDKNPDASSQERESLQTMKLRCKLKSVAALFLASGEALLDLDVGMAQKVFALGKQLRDIQKAEAGKGSVQDLECKECTGIKSACFSDNLGECFEVTEFHIQLPNGKAIAVLNQLRSALWEIEPAVLEAYSRAGAGDCGCGGIFGKINQIINTLNQMICHAAGGKECLR